MPKNSNHLSATNDKTKIWLFGLAIVGLSFLIFGNSIQGDFIYDDQIVLSHSLFNQPGQFFKFFAEPYFEDFIKAGLYRPLTQISFALNFILSGNNPIGFHLFNLFLHILNSFLVFWMIYKLSKSLYFSFTSSILFLVLPIHAEAVSSIVGRAELLSFFFVLSAFLFWYGSKYILSALMFFLAVLSKETAIVLPAVIFIYDRFRFINSRTEARLQKAPEAGLRGWMLYFAVIAGYFALRFSVLKEYTFRAESEFIFNPLAFVSWPERIFTGFKVLALYVQKMLFASNLSPDYSFDQIPVVKNFFSSVGSVTGLVVLIAIPFLLFKLYKERRWPMAALGLSFLFFPYLLVANLIVPIGTIMADRLMYLPSLGLIILAGGIFAELHQNQRKKTRLLVNVFLGLVMVVYAFMAFQQNKIWANERIFFETMYERSPNSVVARTQWVRLNYYQIPAEAKKLALEAYAQRQDFIPLLNLLAAIEKSEGRPNEAVKYLERARQLMPLHQGTLVALSRAYFNLKEYKKAEPVLETLVSKYGGSGNVILHIIVNIRIGNYKEALVMIDKNIDNIDAESAEILSEYAVLKMSKNSSPALLKKAEEKMIKLETFFLY